jgi:hypothetical protein
MIKRNLYTHLCAVVLVLIVVSNPLQAQPNVFIISIDGVRYDEGFGASAIYMPHLYNDLRPAGALFTNFEVAGAARTLPGHTAILIGHAEDNGNVGGVERPSLPNVFEYNRKVLNSPMNKNYIVGGKTKLGDLSYSRHVDYGAAYGAAVDATDRLDQLTMDALLPILNTHKPQLMLIGFSGVDFIGHTGNYPNYLSALTLVDNLVYQLWQKIQSPTEFGGYYKDNTYLIITTDHGRHDDAHGGFSGHGHPTPEENCGGCQHIPALLIGPNVIPGVVDTHLHDQRDVAVTVGELLNFDLALADSDIISLTHAATQGSMLAGKVFLQGPYDADAAAMCADLTAFLPLSQPYNASPWFYSGTEQVTSMPAGVVDWVLVELRSGNPNAPPMSIEGTRAALLKTDGSVTDLDGISPVAFDGVVPGSYYVVVRHRNHLAAMSMNEVDFSTGSASYDFTDQATKAFGGDLKSLPGNKFALYAGDANGDGSLFYIGANRDQLAIINLLGTTNLAGIQPGYHRADMNLDGKVAYIGADRDQLQLILSLGTTNLAGTRGSNVPE